MRLIVGRSDEGNGGGGGEECMGEHMYTYIIYSYVIKSVSAFVQRSERIRMRKTQYVTIIVDHARCMQKGAKEVSREGRKK